MIVAVLNPLLDRFGQPPRLAVFLGQQRDGFGVVVERFGLRIEVQNTAGAVGDLSQMHQCAGEVRDFGLPRNRGTICSALFPLPAGPRWSEAVWREMFRRST